MASRKKNTTIKQKAKEFPDLHIGRMVQEVRTAVGMSQDKLGDALGIERGGVCYRENHSPHWGDTYDLLKVSIALRHDFLSPLMMILKKHKIEPVSLKAQFENEKLLEEIKELKLDLLEKKKESSYLHEFIEQLKVTKKANSTY